MAHEMMLLALQMGVILLTAKLFGWIFSTHLKQPEVLGELVAGMLIGPYVLGAIPLGHLGPLFPLTEGDDTGFTGAVRDSDDRIDLSPVLERS